MAWPGKGKESGKAKQAEEEMRWQSRRHEPGHWQCRWALETSTSPGSFVKLSVLFLCFFRLSRVSVWGWLYVFTQLPESEALLWCD